MDSPGLRTLLRRWRVSLPILILTALLAVAIESQGPSAYQAHGSIILAGPEIDPSRHLEHAVDVDEIAARIGDVDIAGSLIEGDATLAAAPAGRATMRLTSTSSSPVDAETTLENAVALLEGDVTVRAGDGAGEGDMARLADEYVWRLLTPDLHARPQPDGTYTAVATLWLDGLLGAEQNPYPASHRTVNILRIALTSDQGHRAIVERLGPGTGYAISPPESISFPLLTIQLSGSDPDRVLAGFDEIVEAAEAELADRQAGAGVPAARRTTVDVVAAPNDVEPVSDSVGLLTVVVLALGLGVAVVASAPMGFRGLLRPRERRIPQPKRSAERIGA